MGKKLTFAELKKQLEAAKQTIGTLESKVSLAKDRFKNRHYYQGIALGGIVASTIWIALIFIF